MTRLMMLMFLFGALNVVTVVVKATPSASIDGSLSISADVDISVSAGLEAEVSISGSDDSSIYDGPIEWSDDCDCKNNNDFYDDILYMTRRYQDFASVHNFQNYVDREVDANRQVFFNHASQDGITASENEQAFSRLRFRPRVLRGVGVRDTTTQLLGDDVSFPLGIAAPPFLEYSDPEGEIGVAQAVECEGVPLIVSAFSSTDLEQIAASSRHANLWMETYIFFDRSITQSIVERAEASGYRAIVISVDTPELGNLLDFKRQHIVLPDYISAPNIENDESNEEFYHLDSAADRSGITALNGVRLDTIDSPKLSRSYLHRHHILSQIELVKGKGYYRTEKVDQKYERLSQCVGSFGYEAYFNYLVDPEMSWEDIRWIRKITTLPIVIRGILTGCDAIRAVENGANAIIVSNSGGNSIDGAPAAIEALTEVLEAVDIYQNVEVYVEGGIRSGDDIFKALALGADAVFITKPVTWGMLHSGKCGVRRILQILRRELERDMVLMGTKHIHDITSTMVVSDRYYRHRYTPSDVDGRNNQREDKLECPFGYDYDEIVDVSLDGVLPLQPISKRRVPFQGVGGFGYQPIAYASKR